MHVFRMSLEQKFAPEQISLYHKSSRKREAAGLCSTTGFELFFNISWKERDKCSSFHFNEYRRKLSPPIIAQDNEKWFIQETKKPAGHIGKKFHLSFWKAILHTLTFSSSHGKTCFFSIHTLLKLHLMRFSVLCKH